MTTNEHTAAFFNLPLELREQVYSSALSSPSQGPDLLRTCREIHTEARKFLYQRPLTFQSQESLYVWLAATPSDLLRQVSEVSLHVKDISLKPILTLEASNDQIRTPPRLTTWDLYQTELDRFEQALKTVPNIKTITIQARSYQHSFLYREFMTKILDIMSLLYPNLRDLRLHGYFDYQDLAFLSNLRRLESFSFDGFSAASTTIAVDILSNLKLLKNLSLFSQHALLKPTVDVRSGFSAKRHLFTGDVARTINQLASFTVTERTTTSSPTLFFTSDVLASLHEHKTLRSLSINLSHYPDAANLEALESFLEISSIERLELDWPGLQPTILERYQLLTGNLKTLWVRASSESDAFDILWSIVECREDRELRSLGEVVLIRSMEVFGDVCGLEYDRKDSGVGDLDPKICVKSPSPDDKDSANIARAKTRLRALGIHVAWYTETM